MELLNTDDFIALGCIHCYFMEIIREKLNSVKEDRNSHNEVAMAVLHGALVVCTTCHISVINKIMCKG